MQETTKEVSFALCPKCLWLATYFKNNGSNCPQCNNRISLQKVIVKLREEETPLKRVLLKYA
jgi:ssDNA-binding Zn-finger/Zn-ribbon topoisomerase 1